MTAEEYIDKYISKDCGSERFNMIHVSKAKEALKIARDEERYKAIKAFCKITCCDGKCASSNGCGGFRNFKELLKKNDMKKLKVISSCYSCSDDEYYEVGAVNMWDYRTPGVAWGTIEGHYLSYSICKVKNNQREYLTKDFPTEVLEYLEENDIKLDTK